MLLAITDDNYPGIINFSISLVYNTYILEVTKTVPFYLVLTENKIYVYNHSTGKCWYTASGFAVVVLILFCGYIIFALGNERKLINHYKNGNVCIHIQVGGNYLQNYYSFLH